MLRDGACVRERPARPRAACRGLDAVCLEAVRLALGTIRVQKLKSFFTLLRRMIGVTFLIAVVSIVQGMSRYMEDDFAQSSSA